MRLQPWEGIDAAAAFGRGHADFCQGFAFLLSSECIDADS